MKNKLISLKTAKLAEEKGCKLDLYSKDEWEFFVDGESYSANFDCRDKHPEAQLKIICTQSLLQKWILKTFYKYVYSTTDWCCWYGYISSPDNGIEEVGKGKGYFDREEALEAGFIKLLNSL